jgi:hypothetical protein
MPNISININETLDLNYSSTDDLTELEQILTVVQDGSNKDLQNI